MLLAATMTVVACTGIEDSAEVQPSNPEQEQQPVSFNAYVNRNTTRAGYAGSLDLATLKETGNGKANGFGVFAYYTDNHVYSQTSLPDFMYNQQVVWQAASPSAEEGTWTYTPIKYWPNEKGSDGSHETDRLTFFAYAPYVEVNTTTGRVTDNSTTGIVALSRPIDSGDPYVRYCVSMTPSESVDLCWGTPHPDEIKPTTLNSPISFNFRHALAALNVQIDADVDVATHTDPGNPLDGNTRIYVRSITFRGFAEKGQLNLYSTTHPIWNNQDCDCDVTSQPITIYDGRRDGREGVSASLNETRMGLNPNIVQSGAYSLSTDPTPVFTSTTPGVTNTKVNLFDVSTWPYDNPAAPTEPEVKAALAAPIYVIPTNEPMEVTIVYDVETYDEKLANQYLSDGQTHGSTIENNLTATIKATGDAPITMEAGKKYTISLHLGMTSVKVDASVTPWPTENIISAEVHVPE